MYVPIVPAQGKELYAAVCRPRRKEKEWFASRHSTLVNWERIGGGVTDDCWEAANARYHPIILPSYKPIDDGRVRG